MSSLIEQHRHEIAELCRKYHVRQLELFGSAASGKFNPAKSDLDFLVVFERGSELDPASQYLGLLADLEGLFSRRIDLIDVRAARNPYFVAEALKHRVMLYAA